MVDNNTEDKSWVKQFDKCPACGSESRFFEGIGKELKERGLAPADMLFCNEMKSGQCANQEMMAKLPIGGEVPAFAFATDVCTECGCIYAVRIERVSVKKALAPVQLQPNRAERRRGLNDPAGFKAIPRFNNPFLS